MDKRQEAQAGDAAPAKAEWIRPEVDRLVAGGAEAGGDTRADGIDTLS